MPLSLAWLSFAPSTPPQVNLFPQTHIPAASYPSLLKRPTSPAARSTGHSWMPTKSPGAPVSPPGARASPRAWGASAAGSAPPGWGPPGGRRRRQGAARAAAAARGSNRQRRRAMQGGIRGTGRGPRVGVGALETSRCGRHVRLWGELAVAEGVGVGVEGWG